MTETSTPIDIKLVTEIHDGNRKETVKVESKGQLYIKNDSMIVTYEEDLKDIGTVKTVMKTKEDEILIMRTGAISMRHSFCKGLETIGEYKSQAGPMAMRTNTDTTMVQFQEQKNKGKIILAYRLNLQGTDVGRYRLTLSFKEVN